MKKALLVVDAQNYFAYEKAASLPAKIAGHLRQSADEYDTILFTSFRNDPESNFHRLLGFTEVTGPPATDIHPALTEFLTDAPVFEKTTYSSMKAPGLVAYLTEHNIDELDICGISLDGCVLATAFEAFDLGYDVTVLENLCSVHSVRDDYEDAAKLIIYRNLSRNRVRSKRE